MCRRLMQVLLATSLLPLIANAVERVKYVTVEDFLQHKVKVLGSVCVPVPDTYEIAIAKKAQFLDAYWMKRSDAETANATGDLPTASGYMFGFPSEDVGYDPRKENFDGGIADPRGRAEAEAAGIQLTIERMHDGRWPVLLFKSSEAATGKLIYGFYELTADYTTTVAITYRPPANNQNAGDIWWNALKGQLRKSQKLRGCE